MNEKEINELIERYFRWLKDKTITRNIGNSWTEITTPYLDRHNDYLQIYAKKEKDEIILTDDGYIINDLELSGCSLDSPRRKDIAEVLIVLSKLQKLLLLLWEQFNSFLCVVRDNIQTELKRIPADNILGISHLKGRFYHTTDTCNGAVGITVIIKLDKPQLCI